MEPNVVLLTVDSLRYDAVFGADGTVRDGLTGFDRLVDGGVSYESAWSSSGSTRSSMPAILSGEYFWTYEGGPYEAGRPHIAEQFDELGYTTLGFHSNPFLHEKFGWGRGFDHFFSGESGDDGREIRRKIENVVTARQSTTRLAKKAKSLIGSRFGVDVRGGGKPYTAASTIHEAVEKQLATATEPVFLWIHYMDVHNPWYPHEGTVSEDVDRRELVKTFYEVNESDGDVDAAKRELLRTGYEGAVQHFDRELASFLDYLDEALGETLVCLTSDHGELFGENGEYFHTFSVHPKIARVPLVVHSPGETPVAQAPVGTIDVFPTLLSPVCDREVVDDVAGKDLFSPASDTREVVVRGDSRVRVLTPDDNRTMRLADGERAPDGADSTVERGALEDDELNDQLEALGYK